MFDHGLEVGPNIIYVALARVLESGRRRRVAALPRNFPRQQIRTDLRKGTLGENAGGRDKISS